MGVSIREGTKPQHVNSILPGISPYAQRLDIAQPLFNVYNMEL